MALTRARICPVTSSGVTPKTMAAISAWKSLPDLNAAINPSSPETWAMRRISICE